MERMPLQYIKNMMAASLASRIVYKEGVQYVESQSEHRLVDRAKSYIRKEKEIRTLIERLEGRKASDEDMAMVTRILEKSGVRATLTL